MSQEKKFLTTAEVSAMTGIAVGTLNNQASAKKGIPYFKYGRKRLYDPNIVQNIIRANPVLTLDQHK